MPNTTTVSAVAARSPAETRATLSLLINGRPIVLDVEPCATLLDVIRIELAMTGTKMGCDMGACGACTVLIEGRRIVSCLALAASYEGTSVTTIEGIGTPEALHPLQEAFIRKDALQCGYCTPGQILSGIAVAAQHPPDLAAVREAMSGNLCRCGAHPNIVAAIAELAGLVPSARPPAGRTGFEPQARDDR